MTLHIGAKANKPCRCCGRNNKKQDNPPTFNREFATIHVHVDVSRFDSTTPGTHTHTLLTPFPWTKPVLCAPNPRDYTSLEQKIDELTEQLKNEPNEMFEEEASKLEFELRQTIAALTRKLQDAEMELRKFKDLQAIMASERAALEEEIAALKKEFEKGTDWQGKYKQALEKQSKEQAEAKKEIERLQQEVRIVFSIGRRTSDKTVDKLQTMLEEKEERLSTTLEEIKSAKEKLAEFEEERRSLRKLWGLSFRLTSQRLRRRLGDLRKKIFGGVLPAVDTKEVDETKEKALQIRKTRSR